MQEIPKFTEERILVGIGPGSSSEGLIHSARLMANQLEAKLFAVHVEDRSGLTLTEAERNHIIERLRLAEQLGAESIRVTGHNIAEGIMALSKQKSITKIVIGKPRRIPWKSGLRGGTADQLLRISGNTDVYVISGEPGDKREAGYVFRPKKIPFSDYGTGVAFLIMATVLCFIMFPYFQLSNLIMVYLLGVMLTAANCGRGPAILVSLLSVLAFDFCFVPPRYTLTVEDAQYIVTFIVMFTVALVISHLAAVMRHQTEVARLQERQAAAMHGLSRQLANSRGIESILQVAIRYLSEIFSSQVVALMPDEKGKLSVAAGDPSPVIGKDIVKEMNRAQSAYDRGQTTDAEARSQRTSQVIHVPLEAADSTFGVLSVLPNDPGRFEESDQLELLESLAMQVALAVEVEQLTGRGTIH